MGELAPFDLDAGEVDFDLCLLRIPEKIAEHDHRSGEHSDDDRSDVHGSHLCWLFIMPSTGMNFSYQFSS